LNVNPGALSFQFAIQETAMTAYRALNTTLPAVPQAFAHIFATLSLAQSQGGAPAEIDSLPPHLRADLGLSQTGSLITDENDRHEKHSLD
jgi:hypothetical protein